jgi:hypothetical protein
MPGRADRDPARQHGRRGAIMTTRLAEIAPRLRCLLLMLSSDRDGEVVAAARAIGRTLQSAGSDWHDLAQALCPPAPIVRGRDNDERHWRDLVAFCTARISRLSGREREFLRSITRWRGDTLTERQSAWLTAIFERVRREAA